MNSKKHKLKMIEARQDLIEKELKIDMAPDCLTWIEKEVETIRGYIEEAKAE